MLGGIQLARATRPGKRLRPPPIVHLRGEYTAATTATLSCDIEQVRRIQAVNRALGSRSLTEVKLRGTPLAVLIDSGRVKGEEFTAAQDIELAFFALTNRLMIKPMASERVDGGGQSEEWPAKTAKAVARYQAWARHWSERRKQHNDKTLAIVIAAIIDQRSFHTIEADEGLRHGKAPIVVTRALRDYAARAGWVGGREASQWKAEAASSFPARRVVIPIDAHSR